MPNTVEVKNVLGARKAPLPDFVAPQLATLVKQPPSGDEWLHEVKYDGYRMICHINSGKVRFWTRNQKDWTAKFPNLSNSVKLIPATSAILDGEVVVFDEHGHTSFQKLQQAISKGDARFIYEIFDLIYLDGFNLTRCTLKDRKLALKKLIDFAKGKGPLRYSDHIDGTGDAFFKQACKHGLEGIVSKLASSPYESRRSRNWLKVKVQQETGIRDCRIYALQEWTAWVWFIDPGRV